MADLEWGAISSWAAAAISVVAAATTAWNVTRQARSIDARDGLEVYKLHTEVIRKARDLQGEALRHEINAILNFYETLAALLNKARFGKATTDIAHDAVVEGWVWIETDEGMNHLLDEAITGPKTFEHLLEFKNRHRAEIDSLVARRQAQAARLKIDRPHG